MKKYLLILAIALIPGIANASKELKKPVDGGGANALIKLGADVDSPTATVTQVTVDSSGNMTFNGDSFSDKNLGTPANSSTITTKEYGDSKQKVTLLTLDTFVLPNTANGASGNGALLYTLPAGAQSIKATRFNVGLHGTNGDIVADTPDCGIGSVKAAGAVSVLSGTTTFEDYLTGQTMNDANGTVETTILATSFLTNTGGTKAVYLNCADTWANISPLHVNGSILIEWTHFD